MTSARTVWTATLGVAVVVGVAAGMGNAAREASAPTVSSSAPTVVAPAVGSSGPYAATVPSPTAPEPAAPTAEQVTVTRVVDGDTLEVDGARRVRVLGIDACEMSTAGGKRARGYLESALGNPYNLPVTLTREPGVDRDRYGRELRYAQLAGSDLGEYMIRYPEVGVYDGRNDAAPGYVAGLRAQDDGPRDCAAQPTGPSGGGVVVDGDDGGMRDGALTGGYCARRRWC